MSTNPACCPRCKSQLVTRNGDGAVVERLTLQPVEGHGDVCGYCAKAIAGLEDPDHLPRAHRMKAMLPPVARMQRRRW